MLQNIELRTVKWPLLTDGSADSEFLNRYEPGLRLLLRTSFLLLGVTALHILMSLGGLSLVRQCVAHKVFVHFLEVLAEVLTSQVGGELGCL